MVLLSALQVTLAEIEGIFRGLLVQHTPGLMEAAAGAGSEAGRRSRAAAGFSRAAIIVPPGVPE